MAINLEKRLAEKYNKMTKLERTASFDLMKKQIRATYGRRDNFSMWTVEELLFPKNKVYTTTIRKTGKKRFEKIDFTLKKNVKHLVQLEIINKLPEFAKFPEYTKTNPKYVELSIEMDDTDFTNSLRKIVKYIEDNREDFDKSPPPGKNDITELTAQEYADAYGIDISNESL